MENGHDVLKSNKKSCGRNHKTFNKYFYILSDKPIDHVNKILDSIGLLHKKNSAVYHE